MRVGATALAVSFLFALVNAVLVGDAFKKDWITHNYGHLDNVVASGPSSVMGTTAGNQLFKIDVASDQILFYIDLTKSQHEQFLVAGSLLVTCSPKSSKLSLYETSTGVYIKSIYLRAAPVQTGAIKDGVVALDSAGDLYVFSESEVKELGHYNDKRFVLYQEVVTIDDVAIELKVDKEGNKAVIQRKVLNEKIPEAAGHVVGAHSVLIEGNEVQVFEYEDSPLTGNDSAIAVDRFALKGTHVSVSVFDDIITFLSFEDDKIILESYDLAAKSLSTHECPNEKLSASGMSVLVDKPISLSKIDQVHHLVEEGQTVSTLHRWILRSKTHLAQLGRFVIHSLTSSKQAPVEVEEDKYGLSKVLIYVDDARSLVVAKDSSDGSLLWTAPLNVQGSIIALGSLNSEVYVVTAHSFNSFNLRTGEALGQEQFAEPIEAAVTLWTEIDDVEEDEGLDNKVLAFKFASSFRVMNKDRALSESQHLLLQNGNTLQAYKIVHGELKPTWKFANSKETIVTYAKTDDQMTSAIGIASAQRSVLYKYLNPNLVSVITKSEQGIKLTILDGVSGTIVFTHQHGERSNDFTSFLIVLEDNWVIYSYYDPVKLQQLVTVVDLFTGSVVPLDHERSAFNLPLPEASVKSFIYPERILSLTATKTKFGITIRSIVALTESGSIVEIPKYMLNSRRISDRKMTQEDYMDDFRLLPYEPVIAKNNYQVLNHKHKLLLTGSSHAILIKPTELESTSIVCFVDSFNEFCTSVQPSLSYDLLSMTFDKVKLVLTLFILLGGYIASKPFVYSKKLNQKWLD